MRKATAAAWKVASGTRKLWESKSHRPSNASAITGSLIRIWGASKRNGSLVNLLCSISMLCFEIRDVICRSSGPATVQAWLARLVGSSGRKRGNQVVH